MCNPLVFSLIQQVLEATLSGEVQLLGAIKWAISVSSWSFLSLPGAGFCVFLKRLVVNRMTADNKALKRYFSPGCYAVSPEHASHVGIWHASPL